MKKNGQKQGRRRGKFLLIACAVLLALAAVAVWQRSTLTALWNNAFSDQVMPAELPADRLTVCFSAGAKHRVPWYLIAAVFDAEGGEADTDRADKTAKLLASAGVSATDTQRIRSYNSNDAFVSRAKQAALTYSTVDTLVKGRLFPIEPRYAYRYQDDFGQQRTYIRNYSHKGVDIYADIGTPVRSAAAGTVVKAGWDEKLGWHIRIEDADGFVYVYGHLQYCPPYQKGQAVAKGECIGLVGDTGMGEEGAYGHIEPCLHFAMHQPGGKAFDPYPYLLMWDGSV